MKTTTILTILGDIAGEVSRKTVNDKKLAEFTIEDIPLRISAWEGRADAVPESGAIVVQGYLRSRHYQYEGKDRTAVEITATQVQALDPAPPSDEDLL